MKALTDRQREVLEFITRYTDENGFPPTVREIGENFSISLRAVQDHIAACQKKGYLSQCQKRSRSIRVLKYDGSAPVKTFSMRVPVISRFDESKPLICEENSSSYLILSEPVVCQGKSFFAVKVETSSLKESGILEGDFAVFESSDNAAEGQIAAVVDGNILVVKNYSAGEKSVGIMKGLVRSYN